MVRVLDHEKNDLVDRLHDDWTVAGLTTTMTAALDKARIKVPGYLKLLARESRARKRGTETAIFGMG